MSTGAANIELDAYREQLRSFLQTVMIQSGIPGLGIEVSVSGHRIQAYSGVTGAGGTLPMSEEVRFDIGCVMKLLVAMVTLRMQARGEIELAAPIGRYLSELAELEKGQSICVAHLLSHTSGYQVLLDRERRQGYSWSNFVEYFRDTAQLFVPGSVFSYSHTESVLLGAIIERITGRSALECIVEQVLGPLDIQAGHVSDSSGRNAACHTRDRASRRFARFQGDALGSFWAASLSGWTLTLADVCRLGGEISRSSADGPLGDPRPLQQLWRRVVDVPFTSGGRWRDRPPSGFALGCGEYAGLFGRDAGVEGQSCCLRISGPLSIAVGLNGADALALNLIVDSLLESLGRSREPAPSTDWESSLTQSDVVGEYVGIRGVPVVVGAEGEQIVCSVGSPAGGGKLQVLMRLDEQRRWIACSETGRLSLGFFREPVGATPCLLVGSAAFRRQ